VITPQRLPRILTRQSRQRLWVRRVRVLILARLERHPVISSVVALLLLPGGVVLVPIIAWWHRRKREINRVLKAPGP